MTEHEKKDFCRKLSAAGADKTAVRQWLKTLERMERIAPTALADYRRAYAALQKLARLVGQMEQSLVTGADGGQDAPGQKDRDMAPSSVTGTAEWAAYAQDFGLLRGAYDHPFVIAPEDAEFTLTYGAVLSMLTSGDAKIADSSSGKETAKVLDGGSEDRTGDAYGTDDGETVRLLLQNELENLLDLTRERLQADRPPEDALCYYYVQNLGERLTGLSREERVAKLHRIYRREFTNGMEEMCRTALHMDEAQSAEQVRELCKGIR